MLASPALVACPAVSALPALSARPAVSALLALGTGARVAELMSSPVREAFFTFAPVTASFFSCLEPTLSLASWVAAKALAPPSATKSASVAVTFA